MTTYTLTWTIEIDADNVNEAAYIARTMQLDRRSIASVFEVSEYGSTESVEIDVYDYFNTDGE